MTFPRRFGIDFTTFSEVTNVVNSSHRAMRETFSASRNLLLFSPFSFHFPCHFPEPLLESIFGTGTWFLRENIIFHVENGLKTEPGNLRKLAFSAPDIDLGARIDF
jgi:hypothetical protein